MHAETGSMDIVIFCLALMGTDYSSSLVEADRVLKPRGRLWIAEVRSRFVQGKQEDLSSFVGAMGSLGFELLHMNASNKMFVVFDLQKKQGTVPGATNLHWPSLRPCLYKRR